ncbi:outer membrane protein [Paracoccus laeviglucosivorans]|uniref:Lipid A oxidase n=1 Tax=Paracoccus laeviglucosivorans TaxID=1197861 RepID=A0A521AWJ2_9RHOB|nr:outer membrane beta-barrel protein [Paracoccus laeviglucosivorans]SMO39175.1 lipid A oxidase [Paracoccus laeviglucosivorans]
MSRLVATALALVLTAGPSFAEDVIQGYTGWQIATDSEVEIPGQSFDAEWDGESFKAPPYWGLRWTRWQGDWGWGAEFTHTKVKATDDTLAGAGLDRLEFTDGLNILTANIQRRWLIEGFTPYAGAGLGVAIPHVELERPEGRTYEYQLTGPALRWFAGVSRDFNEHWLGFVEYQGTFSKNTADLKGGGELKADITTHAVNIGVGYRF